MDDYSHLCAGRHAYSHESEFPDAYRHESDCPEAYIIETDPDAYNHVAAGLEA